MTNSLFLLLIAFAYAYAIMICIRYQVNGIQKATSIKSEAKAKPATVVAPIYSFNMK